MLESTFAAAQLGSRGKANLLWPQMKEFPATRMHSLLSRTRFSEIEGLIFLLACIKLSNWVQIPKHRENPPLCSAYFLISLDVLFRHFTTPWDALQVNPKKTDRWRGAWPIFLSFRVVIPQLRMHREKVWEGWREAESCDNRVVSTAASADRGSCMVELV